MSNILVYELEKKIYINLTNRCTNDCIFCLRKDKDDDCGQQLWLDSEDFTTDDVINQLKNFELSSEVIFCGYGEPLLKFQLLKETAQYIKKNYPDIKIRINTNGHANYVYKKDVIPELVGLIDEISVSLNGESSEEYDELSQPKFENAYEEVKNFIKCGNIEGRQDKDFFGRVNAPLRAVNSKPIVPDAEEIERNPRSRSAKLRVAEKL